jgi:hypothetical protein
MVPAKTMKPITRARRSGGHTSAAMKRDCWLVALLTPTISELTQSSANEKLSTASTPVAMPSAPML